MDKQKALKELSNMKGDLTKYFALIDCADVFKDSARRTWIIAAELTIAGIKSSAISEKQKRYKINLVKRKIKNQLEAVDKLSEIRNRWLKYVDEGVMDFARIDDFTNRIMDSIEGL